MAVGLKPLSKLLPVAGIRLGIARAGIRKPNRRDIVVIVCDPNSQAAAVFTRNRFCAAPVLVARAHLEQTPPRALLINTGFANAGTGEAGYQDALACCRALADKMNVQLEQVLPFSTGVIGERLPVDRLVKGLDACLADLREDAWAEAAEGIMTTDTLPKGSSRRVQLADRAVTVTGIAKGAGMIKPNMATMLSFLATDAAADRKVLEACVRHAADRSFNRISIDGDTSTNDACVLIASGRAGNPPITRAEGPDYLALQQAVTEVAAELAQAIVRDGEGATKFITIDVEQGASEADCLEVAYTIAHSPLVKTAFFASDPNWGRILAAIGRAPIASLDVNRVAIYLNQLCIVRDGARAADYTEAAGQAVMREAEIHVRVVLGLGAASARVWTCDLSHDYVRINAEYRT